MRPFTISALFLPLLMFQGIAQTPKTAADDTAFAKSGSATAPRSKIRSRADTSQDSFSQWEYWTDVTIPANSWLNLESQLDYSTTDTVRMTIRSTTLNLDMLVVAAYWGIPQAPYYGVADVFAGSSFAYLDAGGATFNTYGSQLRLHVINNGATAITLSQVLLFTRTH